MNEDALHDLLFSVRRSVRYHARRRMFFDRLNLTANALSVIFGSATMFALLTKAGALWAPSAAAIVTTVSAINLVVGSASMARLHADLGRRFVELEMRIISRPSVSAEDVSQWTSNRLAIESDEPPVLRILDVLCHNELLRALGYDVKDMVRVRWWQRIAAQFFDVREDLITA